MFSSRVPHELEPNAWARLRAARPVIPFDLTVSNPTVCDIAYPDDLLAPLADPSGLVYHPHPFGSREARRAIAAYYAERGANVDPERIVLTASSSESYALLFKLLCDPGDAVLVPIPSYPLFEHLARLESVRAEPWPLDEASGWQPVLDLAVARHARAAILVHPNNPTGSEVLPSRAEDLAVTCHEAGMCLIADEVFLDYPLDPGRAFASFAAREDCLTFTLGGLSKSVGLPQLKLSWIVASGPEPHVVEALKRLEIAADSYLSVGTPVQLALGRLLADGGIVRRAILDRCARNLGALDGIVSRVPAVTLERPVGGWTAVIRFPSVVDEERLALDLLERDGVAVHPGYFFDFPTASRIVTSLLPRPDLFEQGMSVLVERVSEAI